MKEKFIKHKRKKKEKTKKEKVYGDSNEGSIDSNEGSNLIPT